jgi:hypothetical protein
LPIHFPPPLWTLPSHHSGCIPRRDRYPHLQDRFDGDLKRILPSPAPNASSDDKGSSSLFLLFPFVPKLIQLFSLNNLHPWFSFPPFRVPPLPSSSLFSLQLQTLKDELRKLQSSAQLLERQRNPGVGYWSSSSPSSHSPAGHRPSFSQSHSASVSRTSISEEPAAAPSPLGRSESVSSVSMAAGGASDAGTVSGGGGGSAHEEEVNLEVCLFLLFISAPFFPSSLQPYEAHSCRALPS